MSWNFIRPLSGRKATVTGRSDGLSICWSESPQPEETCFGHLSALCQHNFNCISRLLSRHIKSVGLPLRKIPSFLWPAKDNF
jgi:hypothetical protein